MAQSGSKFPHLADARSSSPSCPTLSVPSNAPPTPMSPEISQETAPEPPAKDKGKGKSRAAPSDDPTERTPLLATEVASPSSSYVERLPLAPATPRPSLRKKLALVFIYTLLVCILILVIAVALAWSYAARISNLSPDDVLDHALVFEEIRRIDVLNVTAGGEMRVKVEGRMGIDAGSLIGVTSDPEDGLFHSIWKHLGAWGIQRLREVTVTLSTITVASAQNASVVLAHVVPQPVTLPLTTNPPSDLSWLTDISTEVTIRPNSDSAVLLEYARNSWKTGSVGSQIHVDTVTVRGGSQGDQSWRKMLDKKLQNVQLLIQIPLSPVPGLPEPGSDFPTVEELITLQSFAVSSDALSNTLHINATASVVDPAPENLDLTAPPIPFVVSLPVVNSSDTIPIASVSTTPFSLTHPNITIEISGDVLPLAPAASPLLSSFVSRYISARPNDIVISTPYLPDLEVRTTFPGPPHPPKILRDVTIKDMKIRPGASFLASGTVFARIVLPQGFNVDLNVSCVLPDVLVFDGDVPDTAKLPSQAPSSTTDSSHPPPPANPLPDPLPERAFGHIRPEDWLNATSRRELSQIGDGATYTVSADIVDVPLQVLPGRGKEFRAFVGKVIFGSEGATAGLLGTAAVLAKISGLPMEGDGEFMLSDLPFRGSVRIGKKSMPEWKHYPHEGPILIDILTDGQSDVE